MFVVVHVLLACVVAVVSSVIVAVLKTPNMPSVLAVVTVERLRFSVRVEKVLVVPENVRSVLTGPVLETLVPDPLAVDDELVVAVDVPAETYVPVKYDE